MPPTVLLGGRLCRAVGSMMRMTMVRMPVGLLPLLAGRPLLFNLRRAAALRKGADRRCQDQPGKTRTKVGPTMLRFLPIMPNPLTGPQNAGSRC